MWLGKLGSGLKAVVSAEGELTTTATSGAINNLSGQIETEKVEEHGRLIIEQLGD